MILLQHRLSQTAQHLMTRKIFLMYFLQKNRMWTKINVVLINQSQGEEDPDMLPAWICSAHFSHLCFVCSFILNFPLGGVCWQRKLVLVRELQLPAKAPCELPTCSVLPLRPHTLATWFYDIRDFPVIMGGLAHCLTAPSLPARGAG